MGKPLEMEGVIQGRWEGGDSLCMKWKGDVG